MRIAIAAIFLGLMTTVAAADTFMLIPGFTGDSTEVNHRGWLRLSSVEWTVGSQGKFPSPASRTEDINVGTGVPIGLTVQLPGGPWSVALMRRIATGATLGQVTIDHVASDGKPIYRMRMDRVFFKQHQVASTANSLPVDELSMVFRVIRYEHFQVAANGRVSSTVFEWNIAEATFN